MKILILFITIYNLIAYILLIASPGLNTFVFKESILSPPLGFVIPDLHRLLYISVIFFPLWFVLFRRQTENIPSIRFGWKWIIVLLMILVINLPFEAMGVQGGAHSFRDTIRLIVTTGIVQPGAFLFVIWGMYLLFFQNSVRFDGKNLFNTRTLIIITGIFVTISLLYRGLPLPRLEDEIAYYLQSIIFERSLRGGYNIYEGISLSYLQKHSIVPYVIFDVETNRYFSAHMHGWSMILSFFGQLGVRPFFVWFAPILSGLVFVHISQRVFFRTRKKELYLSALIFLSAPLLLILSSTYMSHTPALIFSMVFFYLWWRVRNMTAFSVYNVHLLLGYIGTAAFLAYVRLQAFVPLLISIALFEIYAFTVEWFRSGKKDPGSFFLHKARSALLLLTIVPVVSLVLFVYSSFFDITEPVLMAEYMARYLVPGCQSLGFGEGFGCFPTYGTMGHSFRKVLYNAAVLFGSYSSSFAPAALPVLPVFLILLFRNFRMVLSIRKPFMSLLLLLVIHFIIFALYFHHGGENYRGRYLVESYYAFVILFVAFLALEVRKHSGVLRKGLSYARSSVSLIFFSLAMFGTVFFQIKGDFLNVASYPFSSVQSATGMEIKNSLVNVQRVSLQMLDAEEIIEREDGAYLVYPSEFNIDKKILISEWKWRRHFNLGYPAALATTVRLNEFGFFEDKDGNIFVDSMDSEMAAQLARKTDRTHVFNFSFVPAEINEVRPGVYKWDWYRFNAERIHTVSEAETY